MHHKPLMMHEISKCDGDRACPEHIEWVSRGAACRAVVPRVRDEGGWWQADHAPVPGNVCRSSLLQSRKGISEIEGKAARVAASERGKQTSFNELTGSRRSDFLSLPSYFILCLFHQQAAGDKGKRSWRRTRSQKASVS
jgi:hypothetical protein